VVDYFVCIARHHHPNTYRSRAQLRNVQESSPSHAPNAVAALPGSKDLLDAAANAMDRLIPGLKARQRFSLILSILTVKRLWRASSFEDTRFGAATIRSPPARRSSISSQTKPSRSRRFARPFADILNRAAVQDYAKWEVGETQSVFGKTFPPFGLAAGKELHGIRPSVPHSWYVVLGARNIDGRGFDTERNRPTNLQIPLIRK
jgi:hypothetical protein